MTDKEILEIVDEVLEIIEEEDLPENAQFTTYYGVGEESQSIW